MSTNYKSNIQTLINKSDVLSLSRLIFLSKKIVYISNIPKSLFNKDILYQKKYLGHYGHIKQMTLFSNKKKNKNNAIVEFDTVNQAALTVLSIHNFTVENHNLKTNYFITKYCKHYLNNQKCNDSNCLFFHELKFNDYSYVCLENNKIIDSYELALNVLHIEKSVFTIIYKELIGDNYYQENLRFPKMSMKKIKNRNFFFGVLRKEYENNNSDDKISSSLFNEKYNSVDYKKKIIFKKRKISRFNFINKEINYNLNVEVPESIMDFIDKYLEFLYNNKNNIYNNNDNIYIDNYNCKWKDIIGKLKKSNYI